MPLIYITGPSGAGKSSVCKELQKRGYEAHDTDEDGISAWYSIETNEKVQRPDEANRSPDWYKHHAYRMSPERVKLFAKHAKDKLVFLCGIPSNDLELAEYYDKVICLVIDEEVMKQRVASRETNNFGKAADELELMLYWHGKMLERYENFGATMIDATQSLHEVVDEIIKASITASLQDLITSKKPKVGNTLFIAIDGRGGSGKSTLAALLSKKLNAQHIQTDDFASWDNPYDWWPLVIERVFEPIKNGAKTLSYPRSKWWENHQPEPVVSQPVTNIMILEGVSSLRKEFRDCISVGIFVNTPREMCLQRGIKRDINNDTGKTEAEITAMWEKWAVAEDKYIDRDKPQEYADIVIDGTNSFEEQL